MPLALDTRFYGGSIGMMGDRYWTLAKVEEWSEGRVLIQVRRGIDQDVAPEYFAAAKTLGMIPVQQLVEGAALPDDGAKPPGHSLVRTLLRCNERHDPHSRAVAAGTVCDRGNDALWSRGEARVFAPDPRPVGSEPDAVSRQ
jgi:hypothetical protein